MHQPPAIPVNMSFGNLQTALTQQLRQVKQVDDKQE